MVTELSLLFGSTWVVNSCVIAGILEKRERKQGQCFHAGEHRREKLWPSYEGKGLNSNSAGKECVRGCKTTSAI